MQQHFQRKNYLIDKGFQLKFVRDFSVIILCSTVLAGSLLYYFLRSSTTVAVNNAQISVQSTADFILPNVAVILLSVAFLASFISLIVVIVMSHKLAGPMYRLTVEMKHVTEGDLTRQVRVRTTDQFQGVAETMAEMVSSLKGQNIRIKDQFKTIQSYLEAKNYILTQDDKTKVESMLKDLKKGLDYFRTA